MKLAKIAAALFSAGLLGAGMLYFFAIAGSKFGTLEDRETYLLVSNLRGLRDAELAYEAAFDQFLAVPACPEATPEPAFCVPKGTSEYDTLFWKPEPFARLGGRYRVELDATHGFVAYGEVGERRYVVRGKGEPEPVE